MAPHAGYAPTQPVRQTGRLLLHQWGPKIEMAGVGNAPTYHRLQRRANLSQLPSRGFRGPKSEARDLAFARRPLTSII